MTSLLVTQTGVITRVDLNSGHPTTDALATAIILLPQHTYLSVLKHIQQVIAVTRLVIVELIASHIREHAGYRYGCGGPAGTYVVERHQPFFFGSEGIGVLVVAVEGKVLAACGFAHVNSDNKCNAHGA